MAYVPEIFLSLLSLTVLVSVFAAKPGLQVGGAVMGVLALFFGWGARQFLRIPRLMGVLGAGVLALVAVSGLWSIAPDGIFAALPKLAVVFILGAAIIGVFRNMPLPSPRVLVLLPISLLLGMAIVLWMLSSDLSLQKWWWGDAATGPIYTAILNKSIGILTAFLPAAIVFAHTHTVHHARLLTGLLIVGSLCLAFASQAQSAFLAFVVMGVVFILPVQSRMFWQFLRILVMGGILLAPWIAYMLFEPFAEWAQKFTFLRHASVAQRLEIWYAIAQKIFEHPILGYGYDATRHISQFMTGRLFYENDTFLHPHNMALQVWIEFGALGAFFAAFACGGALRVMEHAADFRVRKLYLATFLSLLSVSLVGWGMWQTWWIVLLFLVGGATVCAGRVLAQEPQEG